MKTKLVIIIGLVIVSAITVIAFSILFDVSYIFDNSSTYQVLDVKMNVIGIKQFYEIGEPLSFSVYVSSLGKTVPWPTLRIYQNYVDIGSEPAYSRMYMTPIESEDKQKSVEWRERIWNFPLESDHSIKFFDKGNYTLRVDVDAKKHVLINFQVVDPTNELEIIDDSYKQSILESEYYQETKDHLPPINSKNKWVDPDLEPKPESEITFDYVIESNNATYGSQYQISGGTVDEITHDAHSNSLIISLNESEQGYITIVIQIGLLHSHDQLPFTYFVIADGEEVVFEQLSPIVLKIPFEKDTREIEIIGTFW